MKKYAVILIVVFIHFSFSSCGKEAATLNPDQIHGTYVDTSSGTALLQVQAVYPATAGVAVDSGIVIVFTKGVTAATVNSSNIIIEQETSPSVWSAVTYLFDTAVSDDDRIIHINPEPDGEIIIDDDPFDYGANYRVRITTGVTAYDGQALNAAVTTNFTTIADSSSASAPYVLAATRTPIGNSPRISINAGYVEVTFSAAMNGTTITSSTFTISGGIGSGEPYVIAGTNNKVFRRNITTTAYNTTYTVTLATATIQSASGLNLVADGNQTWTFTTEIDDGTPVNTDLISSVWVTDITDSSITINWQTSDPVISTIDWGTGTDYTGAGYTETEASTVHSYTISVSDATKYYFIITTGSDTETGYVFTKETGTGDDTALSSGGSDRSGMALLMDRGSGGALNGNAYVTWLEGGDVRASYVTGTSETWEADIATAGTLTDPRFFSDGRGYTVVTIQNGASVYAKMIYNNGAGPGFQGGAWGVDAAAAGINVGTGTNAGASIIWGGQGDLNVDAGTVSVVVASGTAVVLPTGGGYNWFYDFDIDFTATLVDVGDDIYLASFPWTSSIVTDDGSTFRYAINQDSANIGAGESYDIYYTLIDTVSGTADTLPANNLLDNAAGLDYTSTGLNVLANDFVFNLTANTNARVSLNPSKAAMLQLSASIFTNGNAYTILRFTPAVTNAYIYSAEADTAGTAGQLNDSSVDFYVAGVKKGDMVYNVTTGDYAVVAVAPASGTPNTLVLNKSIFTTADKYIVFRVVDASLNAERLTETGTNDSGTGNTVLIDSNAVFNFASNPVYIGDVVHVRGGSDLLVTATTSGTQLTLNGNIATNARYSILQPRALIVYQNSGIYAKMYRLRDGSQYGATITVDSTASAAYPQTVADASTGGSFVVYERASVIYGRYIDGDGTVTNIGAAGFGSAYLVKAIADGSGNAYVLSESGTAVNLTKISSSAVLWTRTVTDAVTPGVDSNMILDSTGQPIVVFSSSANIYVRKYDASGGNLYTAQPVLNMLTGSYVVDSDSRKSYISIVSDGTTGAVISWIDNRYYNPSGCTIQAQAVNGSGVRQWDSDPDTGTDYNGRMIGFTGEYRSNKIGLVSYSYNDGGGAYDPVFFWFDFRNFGVTEIYYDENISY